MRLLLLLAGILPLAVSFLCPDQTTRCDSNKTCCQLKSGGYGCCPVPDAVCCADGEHCCPSGHTCDVSQGTCDTESEKIPWFRKEAGVNTVHCGGKYYCKDNQTCCSVDGGKYACCPLQNAVCCKEHCCPAGYDCDGNVCSKENILVVAGRKKTNAILVGSIVCPDGRSECPDGNTCCRLSTGRFGCCPVRNAKCCPDRIHCCPNDYQCNPTQGTCSRGSDVITWLEKTEASILGNVECLDKQTQCPDGNTCCLLPSGSYGCCPLPNAVCCSDHLHCCPNGYTCDVSQGTCTEGSDVMTWFEKAEGIRVRNVVCPDGQTQCPDGNTCCQLSGGQYGCCPLPNAVCCSDHLHCCPNGYTCDVSQGTCTEGSDVMTWFEKTEGIRVRNVVCPDGQTQCPDGNTCCQLSGGQYGCCPLPDAVCCSDHLHCCPNGYTCDVSQGTCTEGSDVMTWFEKTEGIRVRNVVCPDGQTQCPDGNTCCQLSSGQYGCCPLPDAVCCSDHLHCCPNGYTCDVSQGTCTEGSDVMIWFEKTEGIRVRNVACPDGQTQCPDGNTCCQLSGGQYGCCPLPNAVCCSDHLHCCPNGYTCDVSQGTCTEGSDVMTWFEKTEGIPVRNVVCPDGQTQCPDGNTCCQLSGGQYGCCPLPDAVCCSDHLHCCPNGYTCDVSQGTCTEGSDVMTWFEKTEGIRVRNVVCPDGQTQCPDGNTCCKLSSGQYGCCPLPNAVCCSDHLHCCPNGYTCDVSQGTCTEGSDVMTWFEKTEGIRVRNVVCPDGQTQCPEGNTCCQLSGGQYGCCPLPDAVCCSDHLHCCPNGYTCDVSQGTCTEGSDVMTWFEKTEGIRVRNVVCPDGQTQCPDGNTCCKLSSGQYGCCPLPNAVCCSDHLHCCPNGYTCDVSQGTCTEGSDVMTWFEKTEGIRVRNVICPDGQTQCPDGNTCCQLSGGQYGCCPLPNAVCCSDHLHCCPNGYTCDVSQGTCTEGSDVMTWFEKTEGIRVRNVVCPDGQTQCPDGNTCCQLSGGQYGCCPLPDAVCCSDHLHCCPNGYTCDVSQGTCTEGSDVMTWFEKTEGIPVRNVVCPDGQTQCPDGNTCCQLSGGQYGCCPLPDAVCCSDHLHCCPNGYTCDVSQGTCTEGSDVMTWFEKTEGIRVRNVVCPDGQTQCPDGNTCCKLSSGQYGCCPLPNAVCCSDHLHCCPNGYTCDVSQGTCTEGSDVMTWFEKTEGIRVRNVVCPDGQTQCPDGNTCCQLSGGQYGCCPLPNAVCCSDHLHCCPNGYTCDVSQGTCTEGSDVMTWFEKTEGIPVRNVVCPDGQTQCPDGNTCCQLSGGQYGCCPLPDAVCCSDHLHCCPNGYTCDVSQGTCTEGSDVMTWFEKTEGIRVRNVVCPDGQTQCPDGNTCCKLSSGQYGCCPLPNAVCCSDHLHCCPNGYTCDVSQGTCTEGSDVMTWFEKTEGIRVRNVVCPDGQTQCPEGNTCCQLSGGQYGCCPLPDAVCCSDHLHCCPNGYTCDVSQGTCTEGSDVMTWFEKTEGIRVRNVVCPDGQTQCPDGNTCCQLSGGQYGCCPLPNAVCCSDHLHCCPNGYTCDVSQGTCTEGSDVMTWFEKTEGISVRNVICPDGQTQCPDGNTCCQLSGGQYGCCPLPNAVCCSDHLHCCPNGYTCDVSQGTCTEGSDVMTWFEKTEGIRVRNVVCPDGQTQCPDGNTCCQLSGGQYGCCPLPDAVCCSDHLHCCPNGYTCDVSQGTCTEGSDVMTWFEKTEGIRVRNVVCPDGQTQCPDGNTCCQLSGGQYGCCPLPNAVCCSDHLHCCPNGYTCDVSQGTCTEGSDVMTWFEKTEGIRVRNVVCPDGQTQCPDGNTCCQLSGGQYGCCPLPNAVCCSDHLHCCPNGYTCDVSQGTCTEGSDVMTWFEKTEGIPVRNVVCPDGQTQCPDGNTCCQLSSGQYGCCPLPDAVCCSDHLHCCPNGYTCDVSQGTCTEGSDVMTWFEKTEGIRVRNVVCPDGQTQCPDGNTCCQLSGGQYGCCPLPNAVCCSDHLHCCPNGYTCDVSQGTCTEGSDVMTWFEKTEGIRVRNVVCPDGQTQCPDGNTCCQLSGGQYGCCPLPDAVCCSDHLHCCPNGYTCDVSQGTCTEGSDVMTWFEKTEGIRVRNVVCPDGQTQCPDGNTCCQLSGGQYGCCPLPNAVCCSDHLHCCPNGYTCDVSQGTCTEGSDVMTWFEKTEGIRVRNVVCPDGQTQCPDGNTCCQLSGGQYGCCPLPNAVCCSDHLHCCPNGYTCDVSQGTCTEGSDVMTWFEKTEGIPVRNVVCPDGQTQCPDGNTCCQLSGGQYGCCPLPDAVCCSDHLHCCPNGYTCDVSQGTCTEGSDVMTWFEKNPSKRLQQDSNIIHRMITCPDKKTVCPPDSTCCPHKSEYSCCPAAHASCCPDQIHCCPEDFDCVKNSTVCRAKIGSETQEPLKKIAGKKLKNLPPLVNCKDGSSCPANSTCCVQSNGAYACCPLPQATCCPDMVHCCPHGFKCYDQSSTCLQGNRTIPSVAKVPAVTHQSSLLNKTCKDGRSQCPDEFTCCQERSGSYGCCPEKNAVCCKDHQHCCPSGYTCDIVHASCQRGSSKIAWMKKVPSLPAVGSKDITCPDKYQTCPENTTCCRITDDLYGCCPHADAVCCDDGKHCCPPGFQCDTSTGTCNNGKERIPFSLKSPSKN